MTTNFKAMAAAAVLFAAPSFALAQADEHHPPNATAPASAQMMSPEMMQSMMQMMMQMMQNCMGMMQMQGAASQDMPMMGGMGQGPMRGGGGTPMMQGAMSEASKGYMAAMAKMDAPMMQAIQVSDADVAFVQAMVPHHQGAIDMAKVVLQYGDDEQAKAWANQIIAAQQKEIAEMQEWLKAYGE